jgi:hypothetical protein
LGSALLITALPSEQEPPTLAASSDSGTSDADAVTNDTTPTFTGTAASGAQVALMNGSTSLGTTTAAADGSWSITSTSLAEGTHAIRAVATRGGSVVETLSQTLVIDLTPPELTQPADAETDEDVPSLPVKFVVSDTLSPAAGLLVSGSGDSATLIASVTAGGSGAARNVVVQPASGRSGTAVIRVVVTDLAGNATTRSLSWNFRALEGEDADQDGMLDSFELLHGFDPTLRDQNRNGVPDRICECLGDLYVDGFVNGADLGALLAYWGPVTGTPASQAADINRDGVVNGSDLGILLAGWGACAP